ncbi:MAG: hypothetical protein ACN4EJ_07965 [Porticoccaceae bacterium]
MSEANTPNDGQTNFSIDVRKLFNMSANLLAAGFFKQKPDEAKALYKKLKDGNQVKAGELTNNQNGNKLPVTLELDRSEFNGAFNYPNFQASLRALLQRFETHGRKDPELKTLRTLQNEKTGGILFNLPGVVEIDSQLNVLMAAIEPSKTGMALRLMFMDPEQFVQRDEESDTTAN